MSNYGATAPVQASVTQITHQVRQEEERLRLLRDSMSQSRQLRDGMINILDSFEQRLHGLETAVMPLCTHTSKLQRRADNIKKLQRCIENTLGYYTAANEIDITLKGFEPSDNLDKYLKQMEKLKGAVQFFSNESKKQSTYNAQLESSTASYDFGCAALEREFRAILDRNSKAVDTKTVINYVKHHDSSDPDSVPSTRVQLMPIDAVENLRKISDWLVVNADGDKIVNVYVHTRAQCIMQALQAVEKYVRQHAAKLTLSPNSAAGMTSPRTEKRNTGRVKGAFRKMTTKFPFEPSSGAGGRRLGVNGQETGEEDVTGLLDTDVFMTMCSAFMFLFERETDLALGVLGRTDGLMARARRDMIRQPITHIIQRANAMLDCVATVIGRQQFGAVAHLLPVAKYYRQHAEHLSALHKLINKHHQTGKVAGQGDSTNLSMLWPRIDSLIVKAMEEFIEAVKVVQDRFVPDDATVHQDTANTISVIKSVMANEHALRLVYSDGRHDAPGTVVPKLFTRILSALGLNVRTHADNYTQQPFKALFLLNNYNYIQKSLTDCGVMALVCEQNREVQSYYTNQIAVNQQSFLNFWSKLTDHLNLDIGLDNRDAIKQAFHNFNLDLEQLVQSQKELSIPDLQMAAHIKTQLNNAIVPKYRSFYEKYRGSGFTKNLDKYLKYSPDSLTSIIERLFDVAAA